MSAGTADTDAVNVGQLKAAGRYFKANGANDGTDDASASGSESVAIGARATASYSKNIAVGGGAQALGGAYDGGYNTAIGENAIAKGDGGGRRFRSRGMGFRHGDRRGCTGPA